jgi:hypothetical protein
MNAASSALTSRRDLANWGEFRGNTPHVEDAICLSGIGNANRTGASFMCTAVHLSKNVLVCARLPSFSRGGWAARSKNAAKRPQPRRRGGVVRKSCILLTNTTPALIKGGCAVFF